METDFASKDPTFNHDDKLLPSSSHNILNYSSDPLISANGSSNPFDRKLNDIGFDVFPVDRALKSKRQTGKSPWGALLPLSSAGPANMSSNPFPCLNDDVVSIGSILRRRCRLVGNICCFKMSLLMTMLNSWEKCYRFCFQEEVETASEMK